MWKGKVLKYLMVGKKRTGGRNNLGKISAYHRGGGRKLQLRFIDFKRLIENIPGRVVRFELDPNRSCEIMLINYFNGLTSYLLKVDGIQLGDLLVTRRYLIRQVELLPGVATRLINFGLGSYINNIELKVNSGAKLVRSSGAFGKVIKKFNNNRYIGVQLRSNKIKIILSECLAVSGKLAKNEKYKIKLSNAGEARYLGRRPIVRGVARNPVDHPHGGGEGKTSGGRPSVSMWGYLTKSKKKKKKI